MNKDIRKYIANCALCRHDKVKVQQYPLQMTEIPDRLFDKIATDLVTNCETSTSGNKHILTVIDHLTGWLEAFPIPDKTADTIVATLINHYLLVHICPRYILSDNGMTLPSSILLYWQLGKVLHVWLFCKFIIVVVSTSSVVLSQVRQFFLMRNVFHAINHDEMK